MCASLFKPEVRRDDAVLNATDTLDANAQKEHVIESNALENRSFAFTDCCSC